MATRRRRRNKKWLSRIVILVLLIVAAVVCYLVWDNYFRDRDVDNGDVESVEVEEKDTAEDTADDQTENEAELSSSAVEKKKVEQYDGADPNEANDLSGAITYAGVSGGKLMIRLNIDQYLTEGKCELTLTRGDATIYKSIASIIGIVTSATCDGFDIPVSELGGGNVTINVNISTNGRKGVIRGEASI